MTKQRHHLDILKHQPYQLGDEQQSIYNRQRRQQQQKHQNHQKFQFFSITKSSMKTKTNKKIMISTKHEKNIQIQLIIATIFWLYCWSFVTVVTSSINGGTKLHLSVTYSSLLSNPEESTNSTKLNFMPLLKQPPYVGDNVFSNRIDYTNHSIIKIANRDISLLFNSNNNHDQNHEILWYDRSDVNNTYAFVRVAPKSLNRVRRDLRYLKEPPTLVTSNLQSWLDAEHHPFHQPKNNFIVPHHKTETLHLPENSLVDDDEPIYHHDLASTMSSSLHVSGHPVHYSKIVPTFILNRYHPLTQVNRYLKDVASQSQGVTVFTIGYTHENRPIQAIEILNNPNDPNFMWIDGCTHAREWVTVTTALYVIEQAILSKIPVNFIIVPVLNVDGYVYTWTKDRMWRKNRRPYIASRLSHYAMPERCTGVDLNRNYDINFGGTGSSKNPCSFLYQGPYPFSEPEVRAASDLIANNRHRIKMTLSLHSFNQLWSCPNAFTTERTKDHDHHMRVLKSIQKAVHQTNGVLYDIGPLGSRLYLGSGFMMDWIYHKLGIRDAYLVELRDRGYYGFILPADQIWPTATETWQGIQAAIQHVFL